MKKAKLISHLLQLKSLLARGFAILLLAISVFSSYAVGQSKNQRLQEVERELQEIEVWLSENSRLKQDWLKELRLADLEVQAVKKTISQSNQRLQKSQQSLEKLEEREAILKNKHNDLSRSLFQHIKNTYKLQKSSPLKKLLEGESIDRFDQMMRFNSYITQATLELLNDYENSLNECKKLSKKNNWNIVQDVSTKNYNYVPLLTMAGYSIMIKEISKQTTHYITHIFLQAGVGGMAAGVVAGVAKYFKRIPKIIIVEPDEADCVLQSIKSKSLKKIKIKKESIMGGMSCNEMSLIPWHVLKKASDCCVTVNDSKVPKTVAMLKDKKLSKRSIIGGECATPGIISLISLCNNPKTKKLINLNEKSNVLVIGCEGNADVKLYKQLLSKGRK